MNDNYLHTGSLKVRGIYTSNLDLCLENLQVFIEPRKAFNCQKSSNKVSGMNGTLKFSE